MKKKELISILISVGLSLLGSYSILISSEQKKWIPIIFTILFFSLSLFLFLNYLREKISKRISISFDPKSALENAKEIYNRAKEYGGNIYSSHIYPFERLRHDQLTNTLKDAKQPVFLHRLVFTDDPIALDEIAKETLSIKSNNTNVELLIPYLSSIIPKFLWYILPRLNFSSYSDHSRKQSLTTVGFFRIYTEQNIYQGEGKIKETPTINFKSYSITLHDKIKEYFETFNHGYFEHITSLEEYGRKKTKLLFQARYRSFIAHLLYVCENQRLGIINCSMFGQGSIYEKGVQDPGNLRTDLDADLIMVCEKGRKDEVKIEIKKEILKMHFPIKVIWGPDNDDFYSFRDKEAFNIDIELFEEGEEFYKKHSLLGHSILPNCISIFMKNPEEHRLHKILTEPSPCISIIERAKVAFKSRKGILEFKNGIIIHKNKFDPLRIFSHLIKNTSWVISGEFQSSIEKAINIITSTSQSNELCSVIEQSMKIVSNAELYSYDDQFDRIQTLVNAIEKWLKDIIDRK